MKLYTNLSKISLLFLITSSFFSLQGMQKVGGDQESKEVVTVKNATVFLKHPKFNSLLICYDKYKKAFVTPGGGIDKGETPHKAAVRELREETATFINLKVTDLEGPYVNHDYKTAIFHAKSPTDNTWDIKKHYNSKLSSLKHCEKEMNDWLWMRWDQLTDLVYKQECITWDNPEFFTDIRVEAYRGGKKETVTLKSYVANSILQEFKGGRLKVYS